MLTPDAAELRYTRGGTPWMTEVEKVGVLCVPVRADVVSKAVAKLRTRGASGWGRLGTLVRRAIYKVVAHEKRGRPPGVTTAVKPDRNRSNHPK